MKIVIDDKIPYIQGIAEQIADEVVYAKGKSFNPELVRDADALIIRTRTRCNRELLEGSRVKFIATATIGFDHIDTEYCRQAGIQWTNAPGCNAASVAQYIQSVLVLLQIRFHQPLNLQTIGIVGVGNVGRKVAQVAHAFGMRVLLNDPPREEKEGSEHFVSLSTLANECDIITFHTPLIKEGKFKTFHLADAAFFQQLKRQPIIINSSRGEVIETEALLHALKQQQIKDAVMDVWENEPTIHRELLQRIFIGTPHIAGYAADGKANATRMSLEALCRFFQLKPAFTVEAPAPASPMIEAATIEEAWLQIYNPILDSQRLKEHPEQFEWFRENYPLRREPSAYEIHLPK